MKFKEWVFKDAKWYEFWMPDSGPIGGLIFGTLIGLVINLIYG